MRLDPNRPVGFESSKAYRRRCATGFWSAFVPGPHILDIGYRGGTPDALPILPGAIGFEIDHVNHEGAVSRFGRPSPDGKTVLPYDGLHLPFSDGSTDCVHASHVLEHVAPPEDFLKEWFRVLRVNGTMILMVPHAYLYERRLTVPPSRWSGEHLRSYSPASLLAEVERALEPNTYRISHLADVDDGYDYSLPATTHPVGCLEIELVLAKREPPAWKVEP